MYTKRGVGVTLRFRGGNRHHGIVRDLGVEQQGAVLGAKHILRHCSYAQQ